MVIVNVPKILSHQSHSKTTRTGHRYTTKEYKEYQNIIAMQLGKLPTINDTTPLKVEITFYCSDRRVGDIDNITKPVLDTLEMKGKIYNDRHIEDLIVKKRFGHQHPSIQISVRKKEG